MAKALIALETYVSGLADLTIDYASARLDDEPLSTSPTEGAVQWLLHRLMWHSSKCGGRHAAII